MQIIRILVLGLMVCCAHISAQNEDCESMYRNCQQCVRRVPERSVNGPNECPRLVRGRWFWRDISQCELQRIYCLNPQRRMSCDVIAELTDMRSMSTGRCTNCTTRRTRSTRRTSRRLPTSRRTTSRTTLMPRTTVTKVQQ